MFNDPMKKLLALLYRYVNIKLVLAHPQGKLFLQSTLDSSSIQCVVPADKVMRFIMTFCWYLEALLCSFSLYLPLKRANSTRIFICSVSACTCLYSFKISQHVKLAGFDLKVA